MSSTVIDVKGLSCPLPILRAKKAIKAIALGDVLTVIATDPGSVKDFDAFCRQTGNTLVSSNQDGEVFTYEIRKTAE
jgi:tRNA 2-thiouridine synthesizing protein A